MIVKGWASTPNVDWKGHRIEPYAFKDLTNIPLLWEHKQGEPIGIITQLEYRFYTKGKLFNTEFHALWIECETSEEYSKRAIGFSVGFDQWRWKARTLFGGTARQYVSIPEARLFEVSLSSDPRNKFAKIVNRTEALELA